MTVAFSVSGLGKRYPHFELHDIDLALAEGEIMGLVDVNGAGKTTRPAFSLASGYWMDRAGWRRSAPVTCSSRFL